MAPVLYCVLMVMSVFLSSILVGTSAINKSSESVNINEVTSKLSKLISKLDKCFGEFISGYNYLEAHVISWDGERECQCENTTVSMDNDVLRMALHVEAKARKLAEAKSAALQLYIDQLTKQIGGVCNDPTVLKNGIGSSNLKLQENISSDPTLIPTISPTPTLQTGGGASIDPTKVRVGAFRE